jgi:hypothetical protein
VATISRIHEIIGLFCRIASLLQDSFTKETYNLIDPTNQSHPIANAQHMIERHPGRTQHSALQSVLQCAADEKRPMYGSKTSTHNEKRALHTMKRNLPCIFVT